MNKTLEEITIENENLKQGNIKVWEQLEKSTEILSHHEAYISLLEEENATLKSLLKECREHLITYKRDDLDKGYVVYDGSYLIDKINQVLGEE